LASTLPGRSPLPVLLGDGDVLLDEGFYCELQAKAVGAHDFDAARYDGALVGCALGDDSRRLRRRHSNKNTA
jgi:hypothetical protein